MASKISGKGVISGFTMVYTYQAIEGGASGAPVFDSETGELLGIYMGTTSDQAFDFFVRIDDLVKEIRGLTPRPTCKEEP